MIRIIIGVLIGAGGVYIMLNGGDELEKRAKSAVHNVAAEVAEATEPTTKDRLGEFLDSLTGK